MARGLPLPAADEIPSEEMDQAQPNHTQQGQHSSIAKEEEDLSEQAFHDLTVPIASRAQAQSYNSDCSKNAAQAAQVGQDGDGQTSGSSLLRGRAKTLASLNTSAKNSLQPDMQPKEAQLPKDPFVNGQALEAYLYKDASECPICFLYYPPYLNRTRCCHQAICSECFVQIKRPDPHPPEHADPTASQTSHAEMPMDPDAQLVSEPAACPFCVQPEFGVSYEPLTFRKGLVYVPSAVRQASGKVNVAASSSTSLSSIPGPGENVAGRRRAASLAVNNPSVITTDKVRPDWAAKLAAARAHTARRSAAATALHTAAYMMGGRNSGSETRFGFGRRGMLRRGTGGDSPSDGGSSTHLNMLALMAERHRNAEGSEDPGPNGSQREDSPSIRGPPTQSSRRNRIDDLEDMMMMEAIRLSLAAEDDRRKKEEKEAKKDAKKDAKKKAKEDKKAEKAAKKNGFYTTSANQSSRTLESDQGSSGLAYGKGKSAARAGTHPRDIDVATGRMPPPASPSENAQSYLQKSRAMLQTDSPSSPNFPSMSSRPSHLRDHSNVSSSASSINEQTRPAAGSVSSVDPSPNASSVQIPRTGLSENTISGTPPGGGAGVEPMFNFRSLAAMIGDEEKGTGSPIIEHGESGGQYNDPEHSLGEGEASSMTSGSPKVDALSQSIATLKQNEAAEGPPADDHAHNEKLGRHINSSSSVLEGQQVSK